MQPPNTLFLIVQLPQIHTKSDRIFNTHWCDELCTDSKYISSVGYLRRYSKYQRGNMPMILLVTYDHFAFFVPIRLLQLTMSLIITGLSVHMLVLTVCAPLCFADNP